MPESLVKDLHVYISRRQISKFVAHAVEKDLEEEKKMMAMDLREAAQDAERNAEVELWDALIDEGLDETNEY